MSSELASALSQGRGEAIVLAARAGADARPAVLGALRSPSTLTRHLAVACLRALADPRDLPVHVALLSDPALTVRLQAAQALLEGHAAVPVLGNMLTNALKEAKDPEVRTLLARALGERADTSVPALAELETQQTDPTARAQVIAALAKLGSPPHIDAFRRALASARGDARSHWLSLAEYVHASWLLPELAKLLDDEEKLVDLANCHVEEPPEERVSWLRTCDYAARLIAEITNDVPDFAEQTRWVGLTPEQRGTMREIAVRHSPHSGTPAPGGAAP